VQEASCCRVSSIRGGEVPLQLACHQFLPSRRRSSPPRHIIIVVFIQFPVKEKLEIFAVCQGFIIL
jgi:hypothetical protein